MSERVQTFRTVLVATGGNNVGIVVPDEVVAAFDHGKRVPVTVTVDGGYTYANTISSMRGQFLISFNAETRAATGRAGGDEVEVRLELDDAPRSVAVPDVLQTALVAAGLADAWAAWSFTKRKEAVRSVESAKAVDTRDRRVAGVVASLRS